MKIDSSTIRTLAAVSAVSAGVTLANAAVAADVGSAAPVVADAPTEIKPVAWRNLDEEHHLGGRVTSEGYMRGKVVLVDRWGTDGSSSRELLPRMAEIWKSFKTKPFVLLGGYRGSSDEVKALVEENKLTYPVYEDAGLAENEPQLDGKALIYVVDETGKVRYIGRDERRATEVLVTALTDMEVPKDVAMWKKFLDFELKVLPGRSFIRLSEFRKKFPKEAKAYEADYKRLKADAEVQKLVKLVEFAKQAKDYNKKAKNKVKVTRAKIQSVLKSYGPLKESENALVAQEAKNSLADLKWALTNFPG